MHGAYRHLGILLVAHLQKTVPCEIEEGSRQSLIINNKRHFHPNAQLSMGWSLEVCGTPMTEEEHFAVL